MRLEAQFQLSHLMEPAHSLPAKQAAMAPASLRACSVLRISVRGANFFLHAAGAVWPMVEMSLLWH